MLELVPSQVSVLGVLQCNVLYLRFCSVCCSWDSNFLREPSGRINQVTEIDLICHCQPSGYFLGPCVFQSHQVVLPLKSSDCLLLLLSLTSPLSILNISARKQEIIKMTEQLIEAINNGDFDAYM